MRARRGRGASAALACVVAVGCASNPAPRGWRPTAEELQTRTFGGWIVLYGRPPRTVEHRPARKVVASTWGKADPVGRPATPAPVLPEAAPVAACPPGDSAQGQLLAAGELLAVNDTHAHVLVNAAVAAIPLSCIARAALGAHRSDTAAVAAWAILGALSTPSNGWFLLLTLPTWIVGGSIATPAESRAGLVRYPNQPWPAFRAYARFPQGLPEGYVPAREPAAGGGVRETKSPLSE